MNDGRGYRNCGKALAVGAVFVIIGVACYPKLLARLVSPDGSIETPLLRLGLGAFSLFCIAAGILIAACRRRWKRVLLSTAVFLVLFPVIMELGSRGYFLLKGQFVPRGSDFSDDLGWVITPNVRLKAPFGGYGVIDYSTTEHGFRVFGDPGSNRTRIFVIGDSYTKGRTVSDGDTYYDYLKNNNDGIEIFAYGCGGYSSLQEYMILDRYFDMIRPDMILWQFCPNDIHENSFELESYDYATSSRMMKPFFIDGRVECRFPHPSWIYRSVIRYSYFLRLLDIEFDMFAPVARRRRPVSPDHPLIRDARETTTEIMRMVRRRAGETPVVAFSVQERKFIDDDGFAAIAAESGIDYIPGVPGAVEEGRKRGIVIDDAPRDFHWNGSGHAIAGGVILDYLEQSGLVTPATAGHGGK